MAHPQRTGTKYYSHPSRRKVRGKSAGKGRGKKLGHYKPRRRVTRRRRIGTYDIAVNHAGTINVSRI